MHKASKMGDFAKSISQKNNLKTPLQEIKNGVVKPVEKTFLLSLQENKLNALKQKALDQKTTVRALINEAIEKTYF